MHAPKTTSVNHAQCDFSVACPVSFSFSLSIRTLLPVNRFHVRPELPADRAHRPHAPCTLQSHAIMTDLLSDRPGAPEVRPCEMGGMGGHGCCTQHAGGVPGARGSHCGAHALSYTLPAVDIKASTLALALAMLQVYLVPSSRLQTVHRYAAASRAAAAAASAGAVSAGEVRPGADSGPAAAYTGAGGTAATCEDLLGRAPTDAAGTSSALSTFRQVSRMARVCGCTALGVLRASVGPGLAAPGVEVGASGAADGGGGSGGQTPSGCMPGGVAGRLQLAPPPDSPLALGPGDRLVVLAADPV